MRNTTHRCKGTRICAFWYIVFESDVNAYACMGNWLRYAGAILQCYNEVLKHQGRAPAMLIQTVWMMIWGWGLMMSVTSDSAAKGFLHFAPLSRLTGLKFGLFNWTSTWSIERPKAETVPPIDKRHMYCADSPLRQGAKKRTLFFILLCQNRKTTPACAVVRTVTVSTRSYS